mmetsp:Transcript_21508/g.55866  ORF Transcript_21508/g.55866 Transcript_21508/m.55866 type:complete len:251 (-) Transcript_21508:209-961(-)
MQESTQRVFVGGLPVELGWKHVEELMGVAGEVKLVDVLTDRNMFSKGCALVQYSKHEDAMRAIETLNNAIVNGRRLHVREDRGPGIPGFFREGPPFESKPPSRTPSRQLSGGEAPGDGEGERPEKKMRLEEGDGSQEERDGACMIKMRGLSYGATQQDVMNFFEGYAIVQGSLEIMRDEKGRPTGEAYVMVSDEQEREKVIAERHKKYINDRYVELFRFSMGRPGDRPVFDRSRPPPPRRSFSGDKDGRW